MIFLLDNGTYRVLQSDISHSKLEKKYAKFKDRLKFVLVENNSASRSDCYSIIDAKTFNLDLPKMTLKYTYAYKDVDMPFSEDNTFTQVIEIDSIQKKYAVHNLLDHAFSFDLTINLLASGKFDDLYGENGPVISMVRVELIMDHDSEVWDLRDPINIFASKKKGKLPWDSINDMLEAHGMLTCTDSVMEPKVSNAHLSFARTVHHYLQSAENLVSNNYRSLMLFEDGSWSIRDVNLANLFDRVKYQEYILPDSPLVAIGLRIPYSQIVYLMSAEFCKALIKNAAIVSFEVRYTYEGDPYADLPFHYDTPVATHSAISIGSLLSLCLSLPQKWELDRLVYGIQYLCVSIFIDSRKRPGREASSIFYFDNPKDRGLEVDLFLLMAKLLH